MHSPSFVFFFFFFFSRDRQVPFRGQASGSAVRVESKQDGLEDGEVCTSYVGKYECMDAGEERERVCESERVLELGNKSG